MYSASFNVFRKIGLVSKPNSDLKCLRKYMNKINALLVTILHLAFHVEGHCNVINQENVSMHT